MNYFPTAYQSVIYKTRYARWIPEESRRESWDETVGRYVDFMFDHVKNEYKFEDEDLKEMVREGILNMDVYPSMRAMATAGPALERSHVAAYNCAFLAVDEVIAFDEALFVLMNGTGVGFSVESQYVSQLPVVPKRLGTFFQRSFVKAKVKADVYPTHMVDDSKEGWAYALRYVVSELYQGRIPQWDTSEVRAAGARLETFGGRASGPAPLNDLLNFAVRLFVGARGRRLTSLEAHELMCKIGEVVVVGGVRRAALISLSDLDDFGIRDSKAGAWWEDKPHLRLANNSAAYEFRPDKDTFDTEWTALVESKSGERGIFNRQAARNKAIAASRNPELIAGVNPCGEILLRNKQFCNLSSVTIRPDDTPESLRYKVYLATVIGTLQSSLTDFPYLSDKWRKNCEEERLLGVSLNGVFNNPLTYEIGGELEVLLKDLRSLSQEANNQLADRLGISRSLSRTTNKPEGTVSQKSGTSSGMHPWHSEYYIRRIRADKKDPVSQFLIEEGVYCEDDAMAPDSTYVFSFPIKAPEKAVTRKDLTAIEHLEIWKTYSDHYTDHNPSVTISVREEEWEEVGEWVYENFDSITGVSFLPYDDHSYVQAPYEEVTKEVYEGLVNETPDQLYWEMLQMYEFEDGTNGQQAMACMAGGCDLTSI